MEKKNKRKIRKLIIAKNEKLAIASLNHNKTCDCWKKLDMVRRY